MKNYLPPAFAHGFQLSLTINCESTWLGLTSYFSKYNLVTSYLYFASECACRMLFSLKQMEFYKQYTESNILPHKVILLQLHILLLLKK